MSSPEQTRVKGIMSKVQVFSALRHRNYRLFWFGQLVSVTGFQMLMVTQAWLVYDLTGSKLFLGLTGLAAAGPAITLTLFGGVMADKVDKRRLLMLTQILQAAVLFTLATLTATGVVQVWHIWISAACISTLGAFDQPSRQSLFPHLIDRRDMMNAVALNTMIWQGTRVVGPAMAGVIIGLVGAATTLYMAFAGFLTFAFFLSLLQVPKLARTDGGNVAQEMAAGLRFIRDNGIFAFLIGMTFFNSFFGMSFVVLMPVFAKDILAAGSIGLGFLFAAQGIGGLVGTFVVATLGDFQRKGWLIVGAAVMFGTFLTLFAVSPWYPLSVMLIFLAGISTSLYMVSAQTTLHLRVPDAFRGRVMGIWGLTYTFTMPLGFMQAGTVANFLGAPFAVAMGGAAVIAFALLGAAPRSQVRRLGVQQTATPEPLPH